MYIKIVHIAVNSWRKSIKLQSEGATAPARNSCNKCEAALEGPNLELFCDRASHSGNERKDADSIKDDIH